MNKPELPPYIYGREAAPNEKVWTEAAVNDLRGLMLSFYAKGVREGMEKAAGMWEEAHGFDKHGVAAAIRAAIAQQTEQEK